MLAWNYRIAKAAADLVLEELASLRCGRIIDKTEFIRGSIWVMTGQSPSAHDEMFSRINSRLGSDFKYPHYRREGWYWVPFPTSEYQREIAARRFAACLEADAIQTQAATIGEEIDSTVEDIIFRLRLARRPDLQELWDQL